MAITLTKEPSGIYPAYNDSILEFSSSLADNNKAELTIYPVETFTRTFIVYPDANGKYLFNLKEAVKVIFNASGFSDFNFFTDLYYKSISGLYLSQQVKIEVFSDTTSENVTKYYDFFKAVKQIGEAVFSNPYQLLSYSKDGVNHSITYFEGFPLHFDILQADAGVIVKNLNTGNETEIMLPTTSDSFRINIDRGGAINWTLDNFLPLIEGLNKLEIYEGTTFKSNLFLNKKKKACGVYLKWFNRNGGFSHYLFDEFYIIKTKGSDLGQVLNTEFDNIEDLSGSYRSTGKKAQGDLTLKARYGSIDYEVLKDIFTSPFIQMYSSTEAYLEGKFFDVFVEGTIKFSNKKAKNEIDLTVDLPEIITAKL